MRRHATILAAGLSSCAISMVVGTGDGHAATACRGADLAQAETRHQEQAIMCLTNKRRATRGLPPLRKTSSLQRVALARNSAISRCNILSHAPCGISLRASLSSHAIKRAHAFAENLALTRPGSTPRAVVQLWMRSSPHRRALLEPRFTRAGFVTRSRGSRFGSPTAVRLHTLVLVSGRARNVVRVGATPRSSPPVRLGSAPDRGQGASAKRSR